MLPGGVKRQYEEIRDDNKPIIVKTNHAANIKFVKDYGSNVSCLPGTQVNKLKEERLISARKYQKSDIFNTETDYSTYRNETKRRDLRSFVPSNNEKKLIPDKLGQKPITVRNVFQSQIVLS